MKTKETALHNLRILTVSDFIDKSLTQMVEDKTLEPVDLIISCGDLDPEYLSFLRDRLDRPLFYVKGNHDLRYTSSNPMGCENIHEKIVRFKSLNILGLEGSIWYNGGMNQYMDKEMQKIISGMWFSLWRKGGVHMVVTHAPPRHIHDAEDRCHMGFDSFVKLINKRKPDYFIHGHMHKDFKTQDERITAVNSTKVINTCGFTILEV
ncbi:MAG: metallophosphoesterase [Deltaproteobacteria bacterium]|uniref:metallophosphoesterase family protein n=1 Tax=Desulfobacula sp. TaxID=2593537 RepID=UPI0019C670F8|nr:metallophosphoesterase [Candidatus Desulfobacula maris]MBL6996495.1 metallophosphoesterase [Desulfobacula sp.]